MIQPDPPPGSIERLPAWRRWTSSVWAAVGYLALSCGYAWQVVAHLSTRLAGHGGDAYMNLWNMWWFRRAIESGANPWFTDMLHQPTGTSLLFHTLSPLNCALALPFDWLFGQPVAYNLVFLFSFTASGLTMYWLTRELTGNRWAAFLAGCVFTFSHYHFAHAQGHLNLTAMQWVPLFLLGLVRAWRRRRLPDGVLLGVSLSLVTLTDPYYTVFCLTCALLAVLVQVVRLRGRVLSRPVVLTVGLGAGIWLSTGGLLVVAMLVAWAGTDLVQPHDPRFWSADLQGFFVPGAISAWSGWTQPIWSRWTGNSAECSWYLGYSVLALSVLAFALRPRGTRPWIWAGLAGFGLLMSLGPALHWGGQIYDAWPMPFSWFEAVFPPIRMSGAPGRWHFLALVATAVLAGHGAASLAERLASRRVWRLPAGSLAVVGCLALVLLELAPRPIETCSLRQPGFLAALRARPPSEVVFDLGDWSQALLRQTGHEHAMIGGYIARCTQAADDFWLRSDFTRSLRGENRMETQEVMRLSEIYRLRTLIVEDRQLGTVRPWRLGCKQLWRADGLSVWEVPWASDSAPAGPLSPEAAP
jgi:hypothetical protein